MHSGAIAHDSAGTPDEIVATNVRGTWHVLSAAEAHGVGRVVYFSSAQVFGFADGEGTPDHLPVDDDHPLRAARPYRMSKRLAEEMCEMWTSRTAIATIVLRPVMILDDHALQRVTEKQAEFVRLTLCGPGPFDTTATRRILRWRPDHDWPHRPADEW